MFRSHYLKEPIYSLMAKTKKAVFLTKRHKIQKANEYQS